MIYMFKLVDYPKESLDKVIENIYNSYTSLEEINAVLVCVNLDQFKYLEKQKNYNFDLQGLTYRGIDLDVVMTE